MRRPLGGDLAAEARQLRVPKKYVPLAWFEGVDRQFGDFQSLRFGGHSVDFNLVFGCVFPSSKAPTSRKISQGSDRR